MNKFLSVMVLGLLSPNVWAVGQVPEPQTLFLLGIGTVALLIARKKRK